MATLLIPEHLLAEAVSIIEVGLDHSQPVTHELELLFEEWCENMQIYLEELADLEEI